MINQLKKSVLLLACGCLTFNCIAQNPLVKQWDYRFGGDTTEWLTSFLQTTDGGYILGGSSESGISGDKTQAKWGYYDYWIVKIDSLGVKQWDKDYGGSGFELLFSVQQTIDGGYILGGYSLSDSSGDKTQNIWGGYDYWIVKIDSLGNKQWDKDFGGAGGDNLNSLEQSADGGYILGGWSDSNISGDKTQNTWGLIDYWIVKIDSLGNKEWDRDFGGIDYDQLLSLQQTADGGYILGGWSNSVISGNKTQNTHGGYDYWIVKIDSLGNKQWDKDFGGTINEDEFGNVSQTTDGGYLIAGTSYSPISGNKTENNLGQEQSWIVKTDSLGNMQWDKTIFTLGEDEKGLAIQSKDGCYIIANFTTGGIGGYKTQSNWDLINISTDYWIIKFCDTTVTMGIQQAEVSQQLNVYPNPASEKIKINTPQSASGKELHIEISNVFGEIVYASTLQSQDAELDISFLSNGIYFLKLASAEQQWNSKFAVQH